MMQLPIPTPLPTTTPFPPGSTGGQFLQAVQQINETADHAVQQGVLGVLLLVCLVALVLAIGWTIRQLSLRNKKPETFGTDTAIDGLVQMNKARADEAKQERDDRIADQKLWRDLFEKSAREHKEQSERYINAISLYSDGQIGVSDVLKTQVNLMGQFNTVGSLPMQRLILVVNDIQHKVDEIKISILPCIENVASYEAHFKRIDSDITQLKTSMEKTVEEKRATNTQGIPAVKVEGQ